MKLCGHEVGLDRPLFLIAGPCTAESLELCVEVAGTMKEICARLGVPYIFKASYDKANRSSGVSPRGPGLDAGLKLLAKPFKPLALRWAINHLLASPKADGQAEPP